MPTHSQADDSPPLPDDKRNGCLFWLLVSGGVFAGLIVVGLFVIGLLVESGYLLPSGFVAEDELSNDRREFLRTEVLEEGESATWFYSVALRSIREDGNLLTDRRVISYFEEEGALEVDSVRLEDVVAVRALYGDSFEDGQLVVWGRCWVDEETGDVYGGDTESALLLLADEDGLDHRFMVDLVDAADRAGAQIVSIELGGSVTEDELNSIQEAARFSGGDLYEAPPAVTALMPK